MEEYTDESDDPRWTQLILVSEYAEAAINLYGVISVDEFTQLFNHYEDNKRTSDDVEIVLYLFSGAYDVDYSLYRGMISGPLFQPEFNDYEENIRHLRSHQQNKPRYLPEKNEFLKYTDCMYREPEGPYTILKSHIIKNNLCPNKDNILDYIDGSLIDVHEYIQEGMPLSELLQYFEDSGYIFNSLDEANEFTKLLVKIYNNTRMFENNGFTPLELKSILQSKADSNSFDDAPNIDFSKIRLNQPCPCGSGKKFKRCCYNKSTMNK